MFANFFQQKSFWKDKRSDKEYSKKSFFKLKVSKEKNSFNIQKIFSKCKRKEERNSNIFEGI